MRRYCRYIPLNAVLVLAALAVVGQVVAAEEECTDCLQGLDPDEELIHKTNQTWGGDQDDFCELSTCNHDWEDGDCGNLHPDGCVPEHLPEALADITVGASLLDSGQAELLEERSALVVYTCTGDVAFVKTLDARSFAELNSS